MSGGDGILFFPSPLTFVSVDVHLHLTIHPCLGIRTFGWTIAAGEGRMRGRPHSDVEQGRGRFGAGAAVCLPRLPSSFAEVKER